VALGLPAIDFYPGWLPEPEAQSLFEQLVGSLPLRQEEIVVVGRRVAQPRLSLWMGDADAVYCYSGRTFVPRAWDEGVARLRDRIEETIGRRFNSVLLNLYRDGNDSMGFHADDEPELGPSPVIASVSLGAVRRFVLRPRRQKGTTAARELWLTSGSLLVMREGVQRAWVHGVPRDRAVTSPRLNLTFRAIESGELRDRRPARAPA
jgi:alkylated DNA repair dioxygenase AlkB